MHVIMQMRLGQAYNYANEAVLRCDHANETGPGV